MKVFYIYQSILYNNSYTETVCKPFQHYTITEVQSETVTNSYIHYANTALN